MNIRQKIWTFSEPERSADDGVMTDVQRESFLCFMWSTNSAPSSPASQQPSAPGYVPNTKYDTDEARRGQA